MNTYSQDLKKEREAKNITLADIAKKTRINIKYLEAIEQGAFDILPQTYIRAFIKAYADAIGVNAQEALKNYRIQVSHSVEVSSPASAIVTPIMQTEVVDEMRLKHKKARRLLYGGLALAGLVFVSAYLMEHTGANKTQQTVKEIPFQNIVKEQEQLKSTAVIDTVDPAKILPAAVKNSPDSMVLRIAASDSVWFKITRDSLPSRSGYMMGGRHRTYFAKNEFKLSLSDAHAVKLYLNGIELQPLGKKGDRVRSATINTSTLKRK
ncbi:MAG: DUF4115 domain-containing protein [Bacteroidota bacterium]|nr:DUF4115 domain-containing protein [Bacteroidota bacterium]